MCVRKGFIEIILSLSIAIVAAAGAIAYKYWSKAVDDNPVEEAAEQIIEKQTGVNIDLSPKTPENK